MKNEFTTTEKPAAANRPETDSEPTTVVFRKFPHGDIIALFPEIPGSSDPATCSSYQHIGQHGAASEDLIRDTAKAGYSEFEPLAKEITGLGYRLRLALRITPKMRAARIREMNRK